MPRESPVSFSAQRTAPLCLSPQKTVPPLGQIEAWEIISLLSLPHSYSKQTSRRPKILLGLPPKHTQAPRLSLPHQRQPAALKSCTATPLPEASDWKTFWRSGAVNFKLGDPLKARSCYLPLGQEGSVWDLSILFFFFFSPEGTVPGKRRKAQREPT